MANEVWVIAEQRDGKLKKVSFEILSCARKIADKLKVQLGAILLGHKVECLANMLGYYGTDKVFLGDSEILKNYSNEGYSQVIVDLVKEHKPKILLGPSTAMGKDLLPRVAAKLGIGLASDCIALDIDSNGNLLLKRPIYAGKVIVDVSIDSSSQMASIRPNVLAIAPPDESRQAEIIKSEVKISIEGIRAKVKEIVKSAGEKVDLTEAKVIVSGGRAMKGNENFKILEELACAFGESATVGASRAAVDSGFAPHDIQVGQTGKVVNPELYIACGISGAIQHLAGMQTSKCIIAINKDPEAPIFQKANYGIVGDLFQIVPLLAQEIKKTKAGS
ncbi:MAG: electron transfer flavoprotein subunit alpha/FixB family protein [candidate division Zixibacteria bacterium]|nr:electron transfer flavoprotein subunit alpha/FixB family protein [candidate division Zixibacteria bacterium]